MSLAQQRGQSVETMPAVPSYKRKLDIGRSRNRKKRRRPTFPHNSSPAPLAIILVSLLLLTRPPQNIKSVLVKAQQEQNPQTLNGGSILAMAGRGCVAVAVDKRFGSGPQTIASTPRHVLAPNPSLLVAFTGLDGDVRSLSDELSVQISAKVGRVSGFGFEDEEKDHDGAVEADSSSTSRHITPRSMAALTSRVLYGRRQSPYFVEPVVAGLERGHATQLSHRHRPFLCSHDVIGAQSKSHSFVCSGAASKSMHGTAEALWQPDLEPEELVRVCGRAFLSALERDCLSGYGAIVYLIVANDTGDDDDHDDGSGGCRIIEYDLACRND
jgi:20S proteasome subunit beta 3